jgi:hypothetical protein
MQALSSIVRQSNMGPLVFGSILLTLAGSHALVSGQLIQEKCSANCVVEDGHWGFEYWSKYPNILLGIDFTPDNVMECTYGRSPTYKCRYNVVSPLFLVYLRSWPPF